MEAPEMEFLQWLLDRFIEMNDLDPETASLKDLQERLRLELTPIGGG